MSVSTPMSTPMSMSDSPLLTHPQSLTREPECGSLRFFFYLGRLFAVVAIPFMILGCNPDIAGTCLLYDLDEAVITDGNYDHTACYTRCGKIGSGNMVQYSMEKCDPNAPDDGLAGMEFVIGETCCYQKAPTRWDCQDYDQVYQDMNQPNSNVTVTVAVHGASGHCRLLSTTKKYTWVGIMSLSLAAVFWAVAFLQEHSKKVLVQLRGCIDYLLNSCYAEEEQSVQQL